MFTTFTTATLSERRQSRVREVDDKGCLIVLAWGWIAAKNPHSFPEGGESSVMIGKQVKFFLLRVPSRLFCLQLLLQFFRDQCLIYSSLAQSGFTRKTALGLGWGFRRSCWPSKRRTLQAATAPGKGLEDGKWTIRWIIASHGFTHFDLLSSHSFKAHRSELKHDMSWCSRIVHFCGERLRSLP